MLQQTQVKTVIPYWERWMQALPNVRTLAEADPQHVLKLWEGLGYYSRARNAQRAAQMIVESFNGCFPSDLDEILNLPGIGRYTAGAICSIAFNRPVPILDGNVIRVLCRVFGISGDPKSKPVNSRLWDQAEELVQIAAQMPDRRLDGVSDCMLQIAENFDSASFQKRTGASLAGNCSRCNQGLMELGAMVCVPKDPACELCPLKSLCIAFEANRVADFPTAVARVKTTHRHFVAFLVTRNNKFLVRKRAEDLVNASFWEFPNIELLRGKKLKDEIPGPFILETTKPVFRTVHSITRYRIRLEVYRASLNPGAKPKGVWVSRKELEQLPFTSAHRKVIAALLSN